MAGVSPRTVHNELSMSCEELRRGFPHCRGASLIALCLYPLCPSGVTLRVPKTPYS